MGTCLPLSKHWSTIMKLKLRHWFKPMTGEVINVDYIEVSSTAQWVALFPTSGFMEALSQNHRGPRHPNMLMPDTTGHPQSFFLSVSWQVRGVSGSWSVSHWRNTVHIWSVLCSEGKAAGLYQLHTTLQQGVHTILLDICSWLIQRAPDGKAHLCGNV